MIEFKKLGYPITKYLYSAFILIFNIFLWFHATYVSKKKNSLKNMEKTLYENSKLDNCFNRG